MSGSMSYSMKWAIVGILALCLLIGGCAACRQLPRSEVEFTLNHLETHKGDYLVFTDRGVFEDTDSVINFKFNSSDLYNQLYNAGKGAKFHCTAWGLRIPFFSSYKDLLNCKEIPR